LGINEGNILNTKLSDQEVAMRTLKLHVAILLIVVAVHQFHLIFFEDRGLIEMGYVGLIILLLIPFLSATLFSGYFLHKKE
jgi:hypothetical protein